MGPEKNGTERARGRERTAAVTSLHEYGVVARATMAATILAENKDDTRYTDGRTLNEDSTPT